MSRTPSRTAPRSLGARLFGIVTNLVLAAVTLAAVGYLAPSLLGYDRYVITGGSMSGTFEKGSVAFERQVPVEDLAVGDVITYLPPPDSGVTNLVTHRIVSVRTKADGARVFHTQGDANADPDPWKFTLTEGSQPTVQFTVPQVGFVLIALADRHTRMLVIGIPAALIALLSLVELAGALRPRRRLATEALSTEALATEALSTEASATLAVVVDAAPVAIRPRHRSLHHAGV
jgi:signal peptidase